jgi:outer membrane protein OmpA-like peptidoglycan-associated protein
MIVMAGHILDSETKKPIYSTITVTDLNTKKVIGVFNSNKLTGKYVLALNFNVNHSVEIEAEGYVFNSENVNVSKSIFKLQHNQDFYLSKVKAGAKVTLNNIFFDFNKSELLPQSTTELDNIYEMLITNPNWNVEISGHTDSVGTSDYNLKLSKSRALNVVNYLIEKGINPKHLIAIGFGENKPVSENETEEGRKLNRRTDFTIKDIVVEQGTSGAHGGKFEKINLDNVLEKSTTGIPTGYKLIMKVHFIMNDGDILTEYSHQQLNKVYDILKSDTKYKVKLIPSVDIVGNEYNNKGLYDQRAKTVSTYLMEKGLAKDRILVEEFVPNTAEKVTDIAKADIKKRRVEFLLAE